MKKSSIMMNLHPKLHYFNNEIKLGIIIVPTKKMSSKMSSGPTFYEKNLHEIQRCKGNYPGIPMILGGIE